MAQDPIRFDMFKHFDYFVTESSNHMSEYIPYYRKNPDLNHARTSPRSGTTRVSGRSIARRRRREVRKQLASTEPLDLSRSHEYGVQIIHAIETDTPLRVNANVENTGLITNLPAGGLRRGSLPG